MIHLRATTLKFDDRVKVRSLMESKCVVLFQLGRISILISCFREFLIRNIAEKEAQRFVRVQTILDQVQEEIFADSLEGSMSAMVIT